MCATFCDDRLRGLGVARGRSSRFPIDLRRRSSTLQHSRTTVRVCDDAHESRYLAKYIIMNLKLNVLFFNTSECCYTAL